MRAIPSRSAGLLISIFIAVTGSYAGVDIQNGVLDIPSGYIMESTVFSVGVSSNLFPGGNKEYGIPGKPTGIIVEKDLRELDAYFTIGLFDWVEIGVREYDPRTFTACVKGRVIKETARWPAIAVGLMNITTDPNVNSYGEKATPYHIEDNQNFAYYVVASKYMKNIIRLPLTVHVGVGARRFQGEFDHSKHWSGIFGGVEYHLFDETLSIIAEADGRDLNIGARYKLPWGFTITPYVGELEQTWLGFGTTMIDGQRYEDEFDQAKFGIGVSFTGGPLYNKKERERLQVLRSRVTRAQERLKSARQRREMLERRLEEIRDDLQNY
jgi:hypothetical protein